MTYLGHIWGTHPHKRRRFELVLEVIPRNRRFSICRNTVVIEKRVYILARHEINAILTQYCLYI